MICVKGCFSGGRVEVCNKPFEWLRPATTHRIKGEKAIPSTERQRPAGFPADGPTFKVT